MVQVYDNIIPVEICEELISIFENSEDNQEYMINNYRELLTFIKFQKALQIIKERNKKL